MTRNRCYVAPADWDAQSVRLRPDVAHHLYHALRARVGGEVVVFDGRGGEGIARVTPAPRGKIDAPVELRLLSRRDVPPPPVRITLVQALPKGTRMDWIVEKAVELGVSQIWPVLTDRVVRHPDAAQGEDRAARWQRIAEGAARQCGTAWLPGVSVPLPLAERLRDADQFDLMLVGSLDAGARPLRSVLRDASTARPRQVALVIGPEGDLAPAELDAVVAAGGIPVRFGALTMRLETAALYAMSVVGYELM